MSERNAAERPEVFHGSGFRVRAPGVAVIAHITRLDLPDGTHRGALRFLDDPQIAAAVRAGRTT